MRTREAELSLIGRRRSPATSERRGTAAAGAQSSQPRGEVLLGVARIAAPPLSGEWAIGRGGQCRFYQGQKVRERPVERLKPAPPVSRYQTWKLSVSPGLMTLPPGRAF